MPQGDKNKKSNGSYKWLKLKVAWGRICDDTTSQKV